jgi:hypothetical protein
LNRFIKLFGKAKILGVLGDREFIGEDWLKWLQSENINFFLRLKKNFLVFNSRNSATAKKFMLKICSGI